MPVSAPAISQAVSGSKTPNLTESAISLGCHQVPAGTSDEKRQRVSSSHPALASLSHWGRTEAQRPSDGETGWSPTLEMSNLWPFWHRSQNVKAPVILPETHLWADPVCVCLCVHVRIGGCLSCWIMHWAFKESCLNVKHSFFGRFSSRVAS